MPHALPVASTSAWIRVLQLQGVQIIKGNGESEGVNSKSKRFHMKGFGGVGCGAYQHDNTFAVSHGRSPVAADNEISLARRNFIWLAPRRERGRPPKDHRLMVIGWRPPPIWGAYGK